MEKNLGFSKKKIGYFRKKFGFFEKKLGILKINWAFWEKLGFLKKIGVFQESFETKLVMYLMMPFMKSNMIMTQQGYMEMLLILVIF